MKKNTLNITVAGICSLVVVLSASTAYAETSTNDTTTEAAQIRKAERDAKKLEREQDRAAKKLEQDTAKETRKQERDAAKETKEEDRAAAKADRFCEKAQQHSTKIQQKIEGGQDQIQERFAKHTAKIEELQTKKHSTIDAKREEADARRVKHYANLTQRAQTDDQNQAVTTYKETVEAAVAVKRTQKDRLLEEFWTALEVASTQKKEEYEKGYETFTAEVKDAIASAQTECSDADNARDTAKELRTTLRALQQDFKKDRKVTKSIKQEIATLKETYKADAKSVSEEFRTAVESARKNLEAAFGGEDLDLETE